VLFIFNADEAAAGDEDFKYVALEIGDSTSISLGSWLDMNFEFYASSCEVYLVTYRALETIPPFYLPSYPGPLALRWSCLLRLQNHCTPD
jgi:hypothetical protein